MKNVYLTSIRKIKQLREQSIYTFDVETNSHGFFKLVSYGKLSKSKNPSKVFDIEVKTFFNFDEFIFDLFESKVKIIYCYNIKFDSRFFPNFLMNHLDIDFNIIESQSQMLGFKMFRMNNGKKEEIIFKDFLPFCKSSLDKISKKLGCIYKKYPDFKEKDEKKLKQLWNNFFETCNLFELQLHCESDIRITCELIFRYRKLVFEQYHLDILNKRIYSLASLTMKIYRANYITERINNSFLKSIYNKDTKKWSYYINSHLEKFIRDSYRGGYCGNRDNKKHYNLKSYDINSSYPYQSTLYKFPIGKAYPTTNEEKFNENTNDINGFCQVEVDFNNPVYYLPVVRNDGMLGRNLGFWKGNLTSLELRWLKKYDIPYKFKFGYYFNEYDKSYSLRNFSNDNYFKKSKEKPDSALREIYKTILNALTGKFGQKMEFEQKIDYKFVSEEQFENVSDKDFDNKRIDENIWYIFRKTLKTSIKTFQIPSWISLITASGRIQLMDMIINTNAYYWDSDSVYSEVKNIPKDLPLDENKLGYWKLEHNISRLRALAPKSYCFHDSDKNLYEIKYKGVPRDFYTKELFDEMWNYQDGNIIRIEKIPRFLSMKESLNRKNVLERDSLLMYDEMNKDLIPKSKM